MKQKLIFLITFLAAFSLSKAQVAGCTNSVDRSTNGNFSAGNTGFTSALPFSAACGAGSYLVANNFTVKCPTWPNQYDHTFGTAAGSFMMIDGDPVNPSLVWSQSVSVCPNTNYTFSFWANSIYSNPFNLEYYINGTLILAGNPATGAWGQMSTVWNSGTTSGIITIGIRQQTGGAFRDFGLDDIFFGYCGTTTVTPPTSICTGNCTTLTAGGTAPSFLWSTGATTTSILVCPSTTTSYTVTGIDPCLTYVPVTTTVTVNPTPTVTATASPSTLTPPSSTTSLLSSTVTGGSGFTYSWAPAAGLSSTTVSNPVATPTVTTVYTLTVTNSAGCSGTATTTVTVTPQSLCTLVYDYDIPAGQSVTSYFGALTAINAKNVRINGLFTIDASFNFSQCNVVMQPGSRIETASGTILYITGGTHFYACEGMWDGIYLLNGSSAQIVNASIIEDAIKGVKIDQGASAQIDFCVFNRNYTAVELTANTSAVSPLVMRGCVATCRDIPYSPVITSNPSSATVWANIISGVYASTTMHSPFYAYKSIYGVFATDVNALQVGTDAAAMYFNGFDNLASTGIYLTRSNTTIYNNQFRTMTSAMNCISCTPLLGVGIYATGSTTASYGLKVGGTLTYQPNTFTNIYSSVEASNYQVNKVLNNTITNASSTTATYGGYGKQGVRITPSGNNTITVSNNSITNCATGIWIIKNTATSITATSMAIDNNTISANATGFCNIAINDLEYTAAASTPPSLWEINNNIIIEAGNCINLTNVKCKSNVQSNSCMTRYAATGSLFGIKALNCQNVNIVQNHTKYNVATAGLSGGNILAYGIYIQTSPNMYISCNLMEDAARSFVFDGACAVPPNAIQQNTMRRAQDGLVMLNSASVIGTQGSGAAPNNNYWDMTGYFTNSQVFTNSTTPLVLWVNPGTTGATATEPTVFAGSGVVTVNTTASPGPSPCGPVPARQAAPEVEAQQAPDANLLVYPNPNNGSFTVETYSSESKDVFVYDVTGKLVFSRAQITDSTVSVDISAAPKGLYLVKVISGTTMQAKRILKQ